MDGILRFHIYVTPPTPARQIEGILEFDPAYFNTLFEAWRKEAGLWLTSCRKRQ